MKVFHDMPVVRRMLKCPLANSNEIMADHGTFNPTQPRSVVCLSETYGTIMTKFITGVHSGVFLNLFFFFKNKTFHPDTESVK